MPSSPSLFERRRGAFVLLVAVILGAWVFLYRFNALGGSFGGFDNDHFVNFAYAKQVQAGEQPLRDFQDSFQGARPSLTYELSAAAQRLFGNNLRSEAWLTVGGVALGAAVTFVAAAEIAPWPIALLMAWLSALISPKLYGYPKVLVLAVATLLIVRYAARPSWRSVGIMAVWTAVAFLFRHDYAVYCALGFAMVLVIGHRRALHDAFVRTLAYGALTLVLLAPSLWWVYEYGGIVAYVRHAQTMARAESERAPRQWPQPVLRDAASVSSALNNPANTEAWLFYVFLAVPLLALVAASRQWLSSRPAPPDGTTVALTALGVMTVVVSNYFLRGSLEARFGDAVPPVAVIGASLLGMSLTPGRGTRAGRLVTGCVAVVVLAVSVASIWSLQNVRGELRSARMIEWPAGIVEQTQRISQELASLPAALREGQAHHRMEGADYLHRCTKPTDRVLILDYEPQMFVFAERLFAGGRATFVPAFYQDGRFSREVVARLEAQSVPIAIAGPDSQFERFTPVFDYLHAKYSEVGTVMVNEITLRVFARNGLVSRPLGPHGLPCFA